MTVLIKKGEQRHMLFNGTIRTGMTLDSRKLLAEGYTKLQQDIAAELTTILSGQWDYPSIEGRTSNMLFDVDNKRGNTITPKFFVNRTLTPNEFRNACEKHKLPTSLDISAKGSDNTDLGVFHINNVELRIYDFGYGAVMFDGYLVANRDLTIEEYREAGEQASMLLDVYGPLFKETFRAVEELMPEDLILLDTTLAHSSPQALKEHPGQEIDTLIRVHRIFIVRCSNMKEYESLHEECKDLIHNTANVEMLDCSIQKGLSYYTGNRNSVVVYDGETILEHDVMLLPRIIQVQRIYFSKAEEYARDMMYFNNDLYLSRNKQNFDHLDEQSRRLVEFRSQIVFFRAIFNDYSHHLDPQSTKIWKRLLVTWDTTSIFDDITTRLKALERMQARINFRLSMFQTRKLNSMVLILLLLSMLGLTVGVLDFTQGEDLQNPAMIRIGLLILMAFLLMLIAGRLVRRS